MSNIKTLLQSLLRVPSSDDIWREFFVALLEARTSQATTSDLWLAESLFPRIPRTIGEIRSAAFAAHRVGSLGAELKIIQQGMRRFPNLLLEIGLTPLQHDAEEMISQLQERVTEEQKSILLRALIQTEFSSPIVWFSPFPPRSPHFIWTLRGGESFGEIVDHQVRQWAIDCKDWLIAFPSSDHYVQSSLQVPLILSPKDPVIQLSLLWAKRYLWGSELRDLLLSFCSQGNCATCREKVQFVPVVRFRNIKGLACPLCGNVTDKVVALEGLTMADSLMAQFRDAGLINVVELECAGLRFFTSGSTSEVIDDLIHDSTAAFMKFLAELLKVNGTVVDKNTSIRIDVRASNQRYAEISMIGALSGDAEGLSDKYAEYLEEESESM